MDTEIRAIVRECKDHRLPQLHMYLQKFLKLRKYQMKLKKDDSRVNESRQKIKNDDSSNHQVEQVHVFEIWDALNYLHK